MIKDAAKQVRKGFSHDVLQQLIATFIASLALTLVFGCSDKRSTDQMESDTLNIYIDLSKSIQLKLDEAQKALNEAKVYEKKAKDSNINIKEASNTLLIKEQEVARLTVELEKYIKEIEATKYRRMTTIEREQHDSKIKHDAAEKEKQQRLAICASDLDGVIKVARSYIVGGHYRDALDRLTECNNKIADPATKLAYQQAVNDADSGLKKDQQAKIKVDAKNELSILAERKSKGVRIGMSKQDVLDSSWGKPKTINKTIFSSGVHEQWIYDGNYLYFSDGVLTAIQN